MINLWAEYDIGTSYGDGIRMHSYENVRKEGIVQYNRQPRRSRTVKIFLSKDTQYQTYRKGNPWRTNRMYFYGEVYNSNGRYMFRDKGGKVREIDTHGKFIGKR